MKQRDWILRMKGKHMITILASGEVRYSVGKYNLFILKKDVLEELESLISLGASQPDDSTHTNLIRFNTGKEVITLHNCELYTKIWKIIYEASNVKRNIIELEDLPRLVDYIICFGDPLSEVSLDAPDPIYLNNLLGIDVYTDSLVNLILTKNNKIYYLGTK